MIAMSGRSFSYHRLKKVPPASPHSTTTTTAALELQQDHDHHHQHQQPPSPSAAAAAIQESYQSYYRALGASLARGRRQQGASSSRAWRRRRPRLRISRLARALRRRAAALGGSVRASVARVARRLLKEGRPYIGDLFAGNYMFLQMAPSPTTMLDAKGGDRFAPFTDYYYAVAARSKTLPPPAAGAGAMQPHPAAAAAGVLYKV